MKIATFNVNSIRARIEHVLSFVKENDIDVLLLQETKVEDQAFPLDPLEDAGYNVACFGQKSYNGVAILSRFPLEEVRRGFVSQHTAHHPSLPNTTSNPIFQDARYIEAFTGGLFVASVYVPNGEEVGHAKYNAKLLFLDALTLHIKQRMRIYDHLVLGGDFNVAPTPYDVYDPKLWNDTRILCSTKERQAYRKLLFSGLYDPLAKVTTNAGHNAFTWWDYRSKGFDSNNGLRIDHLLLSPNAAENLQDAGVARDVRAVERPSDHAPVWATFASL